eukprot:scaffold46102_cov19-Tisochrysis_lutea.AAC.4
MVLSASPAGSSPPSPGGLASDPTAAEGCSSASAACGPAEMSARARARSATRPARRRAVYAAISAARARLAESKWEGRAALVARMEASTTSFKGVGSAREPSHRGFKDAAEGEVEEMGWAGKWTASVTRPSSCCWCCCRWLWSVVGRGRG